ncbi:MAG TPA: prepilin peptidase, partial [Deltaproteobacteria bacterium]|nr:prepilin peptidase [Deltaproteobacteria bacterium]
GGGDIKLLAMIGAWMGWKPLPMVLLISSFSGALIGAVFILISGKGYRVQIPFGPFLSFGAILCLFFGEAILNWYLGLFG